MKVKCKLCHAILVPVLFDDEKPIAWICNCIVVGAHWHKLTLVGRIWQ